MAQPLSFTHNFPHYELKLRRSAYDAMHNNPNNNEAPYYEVWDLWINDLILNEKNFSSRPQGMLSTTVDQGRKTKKQKKSIVKRYPDFIVYHNRDVESEGNSQYSLSRDVGFVAEVKPWQPGMGEDINDLIADFEDREFLDQVRDHGKMIMIKHGKARVWIVQCLGVFWRVGTLRNEGLSPFSNRAPTGKNKPRNHETDIEWWPIQRLGEPASDIQQLDFWRKMSHDVE